MTAQQSETIRLEQMEELDFGPDAMKRYKICGSCGVLSGLAETVCVSCGGKLPEDSVFRQYQRRHKSCGCCGMVVAKRSRFCPQCGTPLKD